MSKKNDGLGYFGRKKQALNEYFLIRKARMQAEKEYFASEGESSPERLEAQKARDQEFIKGLKKGAVVCIIFLIFYAIIKTALGLW